MKELEQKTSTTWISDVALQQIFLNNYNHTNNVKFYTTAQYFLDQTTGYVQMSGSEIDGRSLYKDHHHLNRDGSARLTKLFEDKIFKLASNLCK